MNLISINDLIKYPILTPVISTLFLFGVWNFYKIPNLLIKDKNHHKFIGKSAIYFFSLGMISSALSLFSTSDNLNPTYVMYFGITVIIFGIYSIKNSSLLLNTKQLVSEISIISGTSRFSKYFIPCSLLLFYLCSIAPVTDSDSSAYHLSIPLQIIRQGNNYLSQYWLHTQITGTGEYLNLLGLTLGTDNLGSVIQFSGILLICLNILKSLKTSDSNKVLILNLILSVPVLLFLVPTQKHQFIGTSSLILMLLVLIQNKFTGKSIVYSLFFLFYALSLKYSFFLSAFPIFLLLCYKSFQESQIKKLIICSVIIYIMLLLPIQFQKYYLFQDPMAPFLSSLLKVNSFEYLEGFIHTLKNFKDSNFIFPLNLILFDSPGKFSTIIGIGLLIPFFIKKISSKGKVIITIACFSFLISSFFSQPSSRFFVGSFLILVLALSEVSEYRSSIKILNLGLKFQSVAVIFSLLIGVVTLTKGILSKGFRESVLSKSSYGYNIGKWIDERLPKDAFIITSTRGNLYLPRKFVPSEFLYFTKSESFQKMIQEKIERNKTYYINSDDGTPSPLLFNNQVEINFFDKKNLPVEARNPINQSTINVYIYQLRLKESNIL